MVVRLTIRSDAEVQTVRAPAGETILSILQRATAFDLDAPCGGNGACGRCLITARGGLTPAETAERSMLGPTALGEGRRLACKARLTGDCEITLRSRTATSEAEVAAVDAAANFDPIVRLAEVKLDAATLEDQRDTTRRLAAALGVDERTIPLSIRRQLPLETGNRRLSAAFSDEGVIELRPGPPAHAFGVAADIGTSTVVVYLVDLENGVLLAGSSELNAQRAFGADVISRISYASRGAEALRTLQRRIVEQIQRMIEELVGSAGGTVGDVLLLAAAGNTTMQHLLVGVSPLSIATAPFAPVFTDSVAFPAAEIGLRLHKRAEVRLLPSVAAYVGADIVAGIAATSLDRVKKPVLLIDLGTNCEVVLGTGRRIAACATAAGPAFEGAQIECGMAGTTGAIRRVWWEEELRFETVGGGAPAGLCGSGILDTVALLLETGRIDESGLLEGGVKGSGRFTLVSGAAEAGPNGEREIYFSQKDVREVQLAKAAVAAGIEVLSDRCGVGIDEIERVYLAGAFGSAMSPDSAATIGMLPAALRGRVEAVGNTAARGVYQSLRSRGELARCSEIRDRVEYVELSSDAAFRDTYVEHLAFPAPQSARSSRAGGGER